MARKPKKLPTFLQAGTPEQLLRGTTRERDRLLLMVAVYMGLRVSELCKLQIPHLDFERAMLMVREGKGCKDRAIPIPSRLIGPLRGWIGARAEGFVFPSPRGGGALTTRAVQLLVKRVAAAAKLPDAAKSRKYHPHALRHVFASRALDSGANINELKELLGHSSISTTQIYLHADASRLAHVVNAMCR